MILQNISKRVVGNVLINISPSNILPIMLKPKLFIKIVRLVLAAVSTNGLNISLIETQVDNLGMNW